MHDGFRKFHNISINIVAVAVGLNLLGLCDRYCQDIEPSRPQRTIERERESARAYVCVRVGSCGCKNLTECLSP
jgi:hypothetical protein